MGLKGHRRARRTGMFVRERKNGRYPSRDWTTYLTKKTIIKIANATSAVFSYLEYLHNFANSRKISEISWHHMTRAPTLVKFEA